VQSERNGSGRGGAAPVIVVSGLPRSGTSLLMRMLEAGGVPVFTDDVRRADESNPHGYYELEAVKATARDASWVEHAGGRAVKVVHALLPHLPTHVRFEVLFAERDLDEVVASQRAMLGRQGRPAGTAADDAVLVRAFARQLELARRWLDAASNVRWTSVSHRDLVLDPDTAAREIERLLGRRLDRAAMAACVDPALYRSRAR